ncbi:MAG TPA: hypothetical protein VLB84_13585 [Bacteroidia bacterium]|nr:hypothetical protein [Bacteroidia bacterium]
MKLHKNVITVVKDTWSVNKVVNDKKKRMERYLLFILFFWLKGGIACECPPVKPISHELTKAYDVIFSGTVDSVSVCPSDGISSAYFTIYELYKGNVKQHQAVQFDCISSCMMSFEKNDSWIIYATYQRFDVVSVKLCSPSRKQFQSTEQDFYLATAKRSFDEERDFLRTDLGIQSFVTDEDWNKNQKEFRPHNEQPSGMNKIFLLLAFPVSHPLI